jgi:hypothetical protein
MCLGSPVGLLGVAGGRSQGLRTGWLVNRNSIVVLPDDNGLACTGRICPDDSAGLRGVAEVRHVPFGPGAWPGLRRQARKVGIDGL